VKCRHCNSTIYHTLIDLGFAPPSNAYLSNYELIKPEKHFPLRVKVCQQCWLVQTEDYFDSEALFKENYAYFSSTSTTWLKHATEFVTKMISELMLNKDSLVIEVASNDGYLLKNFLKANIPCIGIEPTKDTAAAAEKLGIKVIKEFFGKTLGEKLSIDGNKADLVIGNNVFAHVPNVNDFTNGLKLVLKLNGTITLEFPHLLKLLHQNQFDTIYHEHFSYFSLYTVVRIFERAGLRIFNVEELTTHGGSLRIYGCHNEDKRQTTQSVIEMLEREKLLGLQSIDGYKNLQNKAENIKNDLLIFLIDQKKSGKRVSAYGAAAKGNTLLNYAGIKKDLINCVFDSAIAKQGKFLPGTHIPILPPNLIKEAIPDYLLILPWNIANEVKNQLGWLSDYGTKFVVVMPSLQIE